MRAIARRTIAVVLLAAAIIVPFLIWGEKLDALVPELVDSKIAKPILGAIVALLLASDIVLPIPSSFSPQIKNGTMIAAANRMAAIILPAIARIPSPYRLLLMRLKESYQIGRAAMPLMRVGCKRCRLGVGIVDSTSRRGRRKPGGSRFLTR